MGRYTKHNDKALANRTRWRLTSATYQNQKTHSLVALANRNAKVGKKADPALIETTAHPKRCRFGLSRQKHERNRNKGFAGKYGRGRR